MPCTLREKSMSHSRRIKNHDKDVNAPRAVHPRASRLHALFGVTYVKQHMMIDDRWAPESLTDQFKGMTDLLAHHATFKRHEMKTNRLRYGEEKKRLKDQCRDGRTKLQNVLNDDNTLQIRNILINHKDLQRLYQKMPVHLAADNINQRTFVMRKERDRLQCRLNQLKNRYKNMLVDGAALENRLKFQNEFVLQEETMSRTFKKKIENSKVRFKAIRTINITYKKMIQVLMHDEVFYEPILRSLSIDMEDQANFIKHVLYLGKPAIGKFKGLNFEFRTLEDKSRKTLQTKMKALSDHRLSVQPRNDEVGKVKEEQTTPLVDLKRYVRETQSMLVLKAELKVIDRTIREVKYVTLCSQAREIYPRMKSQVDNNEKLHGMIENDMMAHEMLESKLKCAKVLKDVLINNLSEEEINRLERIKDLKKILREDEKFEQNTLQHLKNRADVYVLMRISLWNLAEIMRHVDRSRKLMRPEYPNTHLKSPLLKFETLSTRSVALEVFEYNIDNLIHMVKRKLYHLMKGYTVELKPSAILRNVEEYHADYLASLDLVLEHDVNEDGPAQRSEGEDILQENKTLAPVPNRRTIKSLSAKILVELAKKDQ